MGFKSVITGLNNVARLTHGLSEIARGRVHDAVVAQFRISAEEVRQMLIDASGKWEGDLSPSTLRWRAWRGINEANTPWKESGWLFECLAVLEVKDTREFYEIDVRIPDGVQASHGAEDLNWVVWTLEYGDIISTLDGRVITIPPRPIFQPVEEEIKSSSKIERDVKKAIKRVLSQIFGGGF